MWFYETLYPDIKLGLKGRLIYKKKTPYQDLRIYKTCRFGNVLLLDGAIQTTQKDEFIYHEMLTHPVFFLHPNPKNILVIGAGDGGVLREALKHKVKKIILVEIDKEVIKLSEKHLPSICKNSFNNKRVKIVIDDGAKFIKNTKEKFDIVIIDSPDPVGVAKVLFSKKFYENIYSILTSQGIMIRQTGSIVLQRGELRQNYNILKNIFSYLAVQLACVPTYIGGFFSFIIASKKIDPYKASYKKILSKYRNLKLKTKYYNPEIHLASLVLPNYVEEELR